MPTFQPRSFTQPAGKALTFLDYYAAHEGYTGFGVTPDPSYDPQEFLPDGVTPNPSYQPNPFLAETKQEFLQRKVDAELLEKFRNIWTWGAKKAAEGGLDLDPEMT